MVPSPRSWSSSSRLGFGTPACPFPIISGTVSSGSLPRSSSSRFTVRPVATCTSPSSGRFSFPSLRSSLECYGCQRRKTRRFGRRSPRQLHTAGQPRCRALGPTWDDNELRFGKRRDLSVSRPADDRTQGSEDGDRVKVDDRVFVSHHVPCGPSCVSSERFDLDVVIRNAQVP